MIKSDLIKRLANRHSSLSPVDIDCSVRTLLQAMINALANGHRIEIRGFGSFDVHYRAARRGRNPQNGDKVAVPAKHVPHFTPGKALRERVNFVKQACTQAMALPAVEKRTMELVNFSDDRE